MGKLIHGMSKTPEYRVYYHMIGRCYNLNNSHYKYYGGRGIKVCDEWRYSFAAFFKDIGKRPGPEYTLERINNDGDYKPDNCKWATRLEQNGNTRRNKLFKAVSSISRVHISKNQSEFARQFNLDQRGINDCLKNKQGSHRGWKFTFLSS